MYVLDFSTLSSHFYISLIVMTHFGIVGAKAGVRMSACGKLGPCSSLRALAHGGGISEWEEASLDLLAPPHASAEGIEGNKDLPIDSSYILAVTGCCIRPWEESVGWLN